MPDTPRVAVIGLDCATPQLMFGDLAAETPNIQALMKGRTKGRRHAGALSRSDRLGGM